MRNAFDSSSDYDSQQSGASDPGGSNPGYTQKDADISGDLSTGGFLRQESWMSQDVSGGFSRQVTEQLWPTWQGPDSGIGCDNMSQQTNSPWPSTTPTHDLSVLMDATLNGGLFNVGTLSPQVYAPNAAGSDTSFSRQETQDQDVVEKRTRGNKKRRKARSLIDQAAKQKHPSQENQYKATSTRNSAPTGSSRSLTLSCPRCSGQCQSHFNFCRFCGACLSP